MKMIPFEHWHFQHLDLQEAQKDVELTHEYAGDLLDAGPCYTFSHGPVIMACAGVQEVWPGRVVGWALVSRFAANHMVGLTRAVRQWIDAQDYRRFELTVPHGWEPGAKWARLLGFEHEATLRSFSPSGRDMDQFVRVA